MYISFLSLYPLYKCNIFKFLAKHRYSDNCINERKYYAKLSLLMNQTIKRLKNYI